jgi:hypothetical protein
LRESAARAGWSGLLGQALRGREHDLRQSARFMAALDALRRRALIDTDAIALIRDVERNL